MANKDLYFDSAATTVLLPEVIESMSHALQTLHGNPSSVHTSGRISRTKIEQARKTIAHYLNASIGEIFFTSCATESNNMVLRRSIKDLGVKRIISSPIEHHCILHTLEDLEKNESLQIEYLNVDSEGTIDYSQLEQLLSEDIPTLVSLMHVNNELGNVLDLEKVGELCSSNNAFFHTDAAQSIGKFKFNLSQSNVHFLSGSAHKFHGPKGIGFLYIEGNTSISPILTGGAQERNMRSGTENLYGIIGMEAAITSAEKNFESRLSILGELKSSLKEKINHCFPDATFNGIHNSNFQSPHILSVSFPPHPKNSMLDFSLDMEGIAVSGGSACASGSVKASHVLEAINADPERKTIRFSFSHLNTENEIQSLIQSLQKILSS